MNQLLLKTSISFPKVVLTTSFIIIRITSCFNLESHNTDKCRVVKCDITLTPEHGSQIAWIQELGLTEASCIERIAAMSLPEYAGFFCPGENLCGLNLNPEHTKALKPVQNKSSWIYAKNENEWEDISKGWQSQVTKTSLFKFQICEHCFYFKNIYENSLLNTLIFQSSSVLTRKCIFLQTSQLPRRLYNIFVDEFCRRIDFVRSLFHAFVNSLTNRDIVSERAPT